MPDLPAPYPVLGIETSCDETSVGIVVDGTEIRANVISSQAELHALYGGVIPELASRKHVERILPVLHAALDVAELQIQDLKAIATTNRPGLLGALLVGVSALKPSLRARHSSYWRTPFGGASLFELSCRPRFGKCLSSPCAHCIGGAYTDNVDGEPW